MKKSAINKFKNIDINSKWNPFTFFFALVGAGYVSKTIGEDAACGGTEFEKLSSLNSV
jgi:hypothetical protein